MDLTELAVAMGNMPKFNVFFPDTSFSLDTARSALDSAVHADPALADIAAMGVGVSSDGMRVIGVPVSEKYTC